MNYTIECIRDESEFQSLKEEWNRLLEISNANSIFLTWEWCSTWWDHFKQDRRLYILLAREEQDGTIVGIAPLIIQPIIVFPKLRNQPWRIKLPVKALAFIGSNGAAPDHLDFITHPDHNDKVKKQLVDYICEVNPEWNVLRFRGLSSSSSIIRMFSSKIPSDNYFMEKSAIPIIALPSNWDDLYNRFNKRLRKNIRRHARNLDNDYPDKVFHQRVTNEEEIQPLIERLISFGRETRGEPLVRRSNELQQLDNFFVEISKQFFSKGWLRLYTMSIEDEVVAIENIFVYNQIGYSYQTGYNQNWSKYSPGNRLFVLNIQKMISENILLIDLLRGEHTYKQRWASDLLYNTQLVFGCRPSGKIYVSLLKFAKSLKKKR